MSPHLRSSDVKRQRRWTRSAASSDALSSVVKCTRNSRTRTTMSLSAQAAAASDVRNDVGCTRNSFVRSSYWTMLTPNFYYYSTRTSKNGKKKKKKKVGSRESKPQK
ncbi:hypothetical protein Hdeb2414_s0114g00799931 [Helianthus debilis subsp. tardiflorus]